MRLLLTHDFHERLAFSQAASDEPFWEAVYRKAFVGFKRMEQIDGDRDGTDRIVHLDNGDGIRVDEKKREKVYQDIILEHISNTVSETPGWIEKDLTIDYLAYAFMPIKRVYLFPWLMLRRAWDHYGEEWKATYRMIRAKNKGYWTFSVAVPIDVLTKAVVNAAIIQLP